MSLSNLISIDINSYYCQEFFTDCCKEESFGNIVSMSINLKNESKSLNKTFFNIYHNNPEHNVIHASQIAKMNLISHSDLDGNSYFINGFKVENKENYFNSIADSPIEIIDEIILKLHQLKIIDTAKIKLLVSRDLKTCSECFFDYNFHSQFFYDDKLIDEIKTSYPSDRYEVIPLNDEEFNNEESFIKTVMRVGYVELIKNKIKFNQFTIKIPKNNQNDFSCKSLNNDFIEVEDNLYVKTVTDLLSIELETDSGVKNEYFSLIKGKNDCCAGIAKGYFYYNAVNIVNTILARKACNKNHLEQLKKISFVYIFSGKIYYISLSYTDNINGDNFFISNMTISYHSNQMKDKIECLNLKNETFNKKKMIEVIAKILEETKNRI